MSGVRRAGLVVAAGLIVTACGGGAHLPTGPTTSPVPTSTQPAPSLTPTVAPSSPAPAPVAAGPYPTTKAGAYALVNDFYRAEYAASLHRDTSVFDTLTLAGCFCRKLDSYVAKLLAGHVHVDGEAITNVQPFGFTGSQVAATVNASYDQESGKIVSSTGTIEEVDPSLTGIIDHLTLSAINGQWIVKDSQRLHEGSK